MITNEKVKIQNDTEASKPADLPVLCDGMFEVLQKDVVFDIVKGGGVDGN